MNEKEPQNNQAASLKNMVIRSGKPVTRPGIRRKWRSTGVALGFSFPFTFPFAFVGNPWGNVQGAATIRFSGDTDFSIIFVNAATVYQQKGSILTQVASAATLATTEVITFTQAGDKVYMHRGESLAPQVWDGTSTGFTAVTKTGTSEMPNASASIYHQGGRMWLYRNRDDVFFSDILDVPSWDTGNRLFSILAGNGDELTNLLPFKDNTILNFKKKSVGALQNINASVNDLSGTTLQDVVSYVTVDDEVGCVAPGAAVQVGENVWFFGYNGIYSLRRNAENNIERQAVAISDPIQSLIDRVNPAAVSKIRAVAYNNYVLFAVPLDGSTINNTLLVYDLLAPSGGFGAWAGYWQSEGKILSVVEFLEFNEELLFINELGIIEKLFVEGNPNDSQEPYNDTEPYSSTVAFKKGDYCAYGGSTIYKCILDSTGNDPTNTTYWTAESDNEHVYDIKQEVVSRAFRLDETRPSAKNNITEFLYEAQNPKLSFYTSSEGANDESTLQSNVTFSQKAWTINNKSDWVPSTDVDNEYNDPHREDYAAVIDDDGVLFPASGWIIGQWQQHNSRYLIRKLNDRSFSFRITNTLGMFRLVSIGTPVVMNAWAKKEIA